MQINRYVTHAVVLLVATLLSGYTFAVRLSPVRGPVNAEAVSAGGAVGDVSLGRDTTIIKPVSIPTAALPRRSPILYEVQPGDTLDSIARSLDTPARYITLSNPDLRLPLKPGVVLRIPPVAGFVVVVARGDTPAGLGSLYGVDPATIVDYNRIRGSLEVGSLLVVPLDPQIGPDLTPGVPADPLDPGQLLCPIQGAQIILKFGPTAFYLEPAYDGYPHFHKGVDLLAGWGTPLYAAAGGTVTAVGYEGGFGLRVEITDSYGWVEIYAHLSVTELTAGQRLQQGKLVGLVGSSGLSTGAHLHFQLEVGGMPTDPLPLAGC